MDSLRTYEEFIEKTKRNIRRDGFSTTTIDEVRKINRISKGIGSICMVYRWLYKRIEANSPFIKIFHNNRRY